MVNVTTRLDAALIAIVLAALVPAQMPESASSRPAASADKIRFELLAPAAESRPADSRAVAAVAAVARIRITNENAVPVILWPFVKLQFRDAKGDAMKPSSNRGRFGLRRQACFLEAVHFITIEPGKSIDWPVKPDLYMHDPASILGWKLAPGEYTLTAAYSYSRSAFVERCKLGCESHPDPARPWNQALELSRDAALKIVVK